MLDFLTTSPFFASFAQMIMRSVVLYGSVLVLVRLNRKIIGLRNPFNFLIFVMLGSLGAAALTLEDLFLPIFGLIIFLFIFNACIAYTVSHVPTLERLMTGSPIVIIKDGKVLWSRLKDNYITRTELRNELQEQLQTNDFSIVQTAYLASDGTINFVTKENSKK